MFLNETCNGVHIGKHLPHNFPFPNGLKEGDDLSPVLLNFTSEHAIRKA
jgi:hypothetical protein